MQERTELLDKLHAGTITKDEINRLARICDRMARGVKSFYDTESGNVLRLRSAQHAQNHYTAEVVLVSGYAEAE